VLTGLAAEHSNGHWPSRAANHPSVIERFEFFWVFVFIYDMSSPFVTTHTRDPASRISTRGTQDCAIWTGVESSPRVLLNQFPSVCVHSSSLEFSQSSWLNSCRAVLLLLFVVTHVGDPKLVVYTTLCRSLKLPINGMNGYCSRYPFF
jgi:hypothetical protein